MLLSIDLNGRIPTGLQGVTGSLAHRDPYQNGQHMATCAQDVGMWFPATSGRRVPLRPHNGAEHRIDYIGPE